MATNVRVAKKAHAPAKSGIAEAEAKPSAKPAAKPRSDAMDAKPAKGSGAATTVNGITSREQNGIVKVDVNADEMKANAKPPDGLVGDFKYGQLLWSKENNWALLRPTPGGETDGMALYKVGSGTGSFDSRYPQIVRSGANKYELYKDMNHTDGKPLHRFEITLHGEAGPVDEPLPPPTEAQAKVIEPWEKNFNEETGGMEIPEGWEIKGSELPRGSDAAAKLSKLKADPGGNDKPVVYRHPDTHSYAIFSQTHEEADARLFVYSPEGKKMGLINMDGSPGYDVIGAKE